MSRIYLERNIECLYKLYNAAFVHTGHVIECTNDYLCPSACQTIFLITYSFQFLFILYCTKKKVYAMFEWHHGDLIKAVCFCSIRKKDYSEGKYAFLSSGF